MTEPDSRWFEYEITCACGAKLSHRSRSIALTRFWDHLRDCPSKAEDRASAGWVERDSMSGGDGFLPQSEGWYLEPELRFLRDTALSLPESMGPMLEVGCFKGLSTSAIAQVGQVLVVDNFRGAPPEYSPAGDDLVQAFWQNMVRIGADKNIMLLRGDSKDVLPQMKGIVKFVETSGKVFREMRLPFRLIHLDSDHTSPAVDRDVRECWRLLAPGGVFVMDDVDWPDVGRAANSLPVPLEHFDKKVGFVRKPPGWGVTDEHFFDVYDAAFFAKHVEEPVFSDTASVGRAIDAVLRPNSVVDVGCAVGAMLGGIRDSAAGRDPTVRCAGVESASGIERMAAAGLMRIPKEWYVAWDLRQPGVPPGLLDRGRFDVAVSAEVAEHLPPECADVHVDLLCALADTVVFTAAHPGQDGDQHLNERGWEYWRGLFAARGYEHDGAATEAIIAGFRESLTRVKWYADNMRVYRRA